MLQNLLEPAERKPLEKKHKRTTKAHQKKLKELDEKIQDMEKEITDESASGFDEFYEEEYLDESEEGW